MYGCPGDRPCHATGLGASLLTCAIYVALFPHVFFGESFARALNKIFAGDIVNAKGLWLALLVGGIVLLWIGLHAARSHDDPVNSFVLFGSALIVIPCLWGLGNGIYAAGSAFNWHASPAAWLSFLAFGLGNIWLELRGIFKRRPAEAPAMQVQEPLPRRVRVLKIIEWSSGDNHLPPLPEIQSLQARPAIGQGRTLPQIAYVPDENGQLIPVRIETPSRVIEHRP
jgi:hypothetical protein